MNIKLKINGREVSSDNPGSAVEGAVLAKVKEQMTQKLSQTPKFEIEGDSIQNLKIHFRPCCEWMREEAERVLNQK
jgi:hypothetical protein